MAAFRELPVGARQQAGSRPYHLRAANRYVGFAGYARYSVYECRPYRTEQEWYRRGNFAFVS